MTSLKNNSPQPIHTLQRAEQVLSAYIPLAATYAGDDMSLVRMWPLLDAVDNPQDQLRAIHIAGTSGKTSTAYYTAHTLTTAGCKTGLTVSPHVDSITERIQINGAPISDELFCSYLTEFMQLTSHVDVQPSYFELLTVFELWVFMQEGVDYAVVETGLGGLLDASNVLRREGKVCVITDIGYDHTEVLGDTLAEIAAQKAGIIHAGSTVWMYWQSDEVMVQVDARVQEMGAQLYLAKATNGTESALPQFQQRNWQLASQICEYVAQRDGLKQVQVDPVSVLVPGRMEQRQLENGAVLVMDGAHNQQKMQAFVDSYQALYPGQTADVLVAFKSGKDYSRALRILQPITDRLIVSVFDVGQDMPTRAVDPTLVQSEAEKLGINSRIVMNLPQAYSELVELPGTHKIATGSIYLLSQLRAIIADAEK